MASSTATKKETSTEIKYPSMFEVILYNDDFTPMDFVVELLIEIFNKNISEAKDIMLRVHSQGSALAGIYSKEIAEQKTAEATALSRLSSYPLVVSYAEA